MFKWFTNLFAKSGADNNAKETPIPPGTRVHVDKRQVGTLSALDDGPDGITRARVVFVHPRRTWIEEVSLHRIDLCLD